MMPTARSTTISGLYLTKRAKDLARWLQRTGLMSKQEVIDGYLVRAARVGSIANGLVIDPPGAVVVFHRSDPGFAAGWGVYAVGSRDNFDSRLNLPDGTYSAEGEPAASLRTWFWALGFDPYEELPPPAQTPWQAAVVSAIDGAYIHKREKLITSRIKVFPASAFKGVVAYPTLAATDVFAEARVIGHATASTPGFAFSADWLADFTGGYRPVRNVAADLVGGYNGIIYAGFEYQGDAPMLAYGGRFGLVVLPLINNIETDLAAGIAHWGHSAVLFLLYEVPGPINVEGNAPVLRWSRLWSPDEHGVDFFHNGPWLSYPSPGHTPQFLAVQEYWNDWWSAWSAADKPTPAGGSRPNWTDAISIAWHEDRFVVNLRCCALNGVFNRLEEAAEDYWTAGGSAHMRFEIVPLDESVSFTATEVEHEIWDAPERHPGADSSDTPYARWVVGELDVDDLRCANPLCTFVDAGRLFEVVWKMEGDRRDVAFPTGPNGLQSAFTSTGRIEVKVKLPEGAPLAHTVNFDSLGAGVVGPAVELAGQVYLVPPTQSYKMRALESQFALISANELAFLARQTWVFSASAPFEFAQLAVLNLETGLAEVRSEVPIRMPNTLSHMVPAHLDCVQRTIYDDEGEVKVEGVLIATGPDTTSTAYISRDSGRTWAEYFTGITDNTPQRAVYYIGNPLGGGSKPGRAVI